MSAFKDGGQVIVPVPLEFTGFVFTVLSMLTALLSRNKMIIQAKNRKGPSAIHRPDNDFFNLCKMLENCETTDIDDTRSIKNI